MNPYVLGRLYGWSVLSVSRSVIISEKGREVTREKERDSKESKQDICTYVLFFSFLLKITQHHFKEANYLFGTRRSLAVVR